MPGSETSQNLQDLRSGGPPLPIRRKGDQSFEQASLSSEFTSPEEYRQLLKPLIEYARARAQHVFEHTGSRADVKREVQRTDVETARLIASRPEFERRDVAQYALRAMRGAYRAELKRLVKSDFRRFEDDLNSIEDFVHEGGVRIGMLRGQSDASSEVNMAKMNLHYGLEEMKTGSHRSLFHRYPFLERKLAQIQELGEEEGEEKYLRARGVSSRIRRLLKKNHFDQVHAEFSNLSMDEREMVNESHRAVYKMSLADDLNERFVDLRKQDETAVVRWRSIKTWPNVITNVKKKAQTLKRWLGLGATLKTALEDKYGAEAGIVLVAWQKLGKVGAALNFRSRRKAPEGEKLSFRQELKGFFGELRQVRDQLLKTDESEKLSFIGSVKRAFKEVAEIDKRLLNYLEESERSRLEGLLNGNKITAASDAIFLALSRSESRVLGKIHRVLGIRGRAESLFLTLDSLTPEELRKVEADFKDRYAEKLSCADMREACSYRLKGPERDQAMATLDENSSARLAARLQRAFKTKSNKDDVAALRVAADRTPEQLKEVRQILETEYGIDFDNDKKLAKQIKKSTPETRDWVRKLFSGTVEEARAARLDAALHGKSGEWVGEIFYDHFRDENLKIIDAYNQRPGRRAKLWKIPMPWKRQRDFWREFKKIFKHERADIMRSLIDNGTLTEAEQLRHCMLGVTVNVKGILSVLSGKTAEQQAALSMEYAKRFSRPIRTPLGLFDAGVGALIEKGHSLLPGRMSVSFPEAFRSRLRVSRNLDRDLKFSLCGHPRFDALMLRRGHTDDPHEIYERMKIRLKHERSGLVSWIFEKSEDGKLMRQNFKHAESYYQKEINGQPFDAEKRKIFEMKVLAASQALDQFRGLKERVGTLVANVASIGAVVIPAFVIGTSFALYPYLAPLAFGLSFGTRVATKRFTKGKGYGIREMGLDLYLASVDGITVFASKLLKGYAAFRALAASKPILVHGSATVAKGQAKGQLRKLGTKMFSRRYQELESGHALRLKELEMERKREMKGQHMTSELSDHHTKKYQEDDRIPEVGENVIRLAMRFRARGGGAAAAGI